ncbi:hypothetical protein UFOVP95_13 [uncultured Caudovirales phage]|uniref:Uncharacterized protein n=1 Tax=uncultured Caudovirales phage TaxID=2100421 RepID=A0A6J5KZQ0_9CAUD|nr:hypothetical protein UFOVP95_13 [uncultured Caudovirales phage]
MVFRVAGGGSGGGGSGLTVGTTTVTGATNGYVLYNNNGVLGSQAASAASLSIGSAITGGTNGYGLYVNSSTQLGQFSYGTGVFTALGLATNAASGLVAKDANSNITGNAFFAGFTSVAASGTAITLTAASTPTYVITGSGGQTVTLPNATTLSNGAIFSFNNNQSSGAITVNNASSTLIVSVPSGGYTTVVLLNNGTSAGTWDRHDQSPSNVSWSTNTFDYPGSITSATWNGVAIAANRGGTGQSAVTTGDLLYGSASNTWSRLADVAVGSVLVSGGVGAAPSWSTTPSLSTIKIGSGNFQAEQNVLYTSTTSATPSVLTTDGNAAGSTNQIILPNSAAYMFSILIVARQQAAGGTLTGSWKIEGVIRREGTAASTTLISSSLTTFSNPTSWAIAVSADTTNGGLAITATGTASTNIRWSASATTSEVIYA